ncbi:hypothetical protein [Halomicrobium urmianum]|uniref:hypothetical protein n=1 Tax=Halomicrobium urmianum TaxID=1586233 RepID=UPI001CD9F1B2|nr:hypothetical protein [Halomicrobium urmianum]
MRDARRDVLERPADEGLFDPDEPVEDGVVHPEYFGEAFDVSTASWTHYPNLEELVEGDELMDFFERFLGEKPLALDRGLHPAFALDAKAREMLETSDRGDVHHRPPEEREGGENALRVTPDDDRRRRPRPLDVRDDIVSLRTQTYMHRRKRV